jgi:hypothetical protein
MELGDPMPPCDGRLVKCHLIPRQVLRRHGVGEMAPGSWVWGCGGPTGSGGHHGMFDFSRTLRLSREMIPQDTERLAKTVGLLWYLDREYGRRERAPRP